MVQGLGIGGSPYKLDRPAFPASLPENAITTSDVLAGFVNVRALGIVNGMASNAQPFAYKSDNPYRAALVHMAFEAAQLGANAILAVHYQVFPEPSSGGPVVLAYGTAAIVQAG